MMISFLGVRTDGRTVRHGFGILIWKHVGTKNFNSKFKIKSLLATNAAISPSLFSSALFFTLFCILLINSSATQEKAVK